MEAEADDTDTAHLQDLNHPLNPAPKESTPDVAPLTALVFSDNARDIDVEVIHLEHEAHRSQRLDSSFPAPTPTAWVRVLAPLTPFPNIFDFVPQPESAPSHPDPEKPATPVISLSDNRKDAPKVALTESAQVLTADIRIQEKLLEFESLQLYLDDPEYAAKLDILEHLQAERGYVPPTDWPPFGWASVYQLGWWLAYEVMLLRRDISPRILDLDENLSLDGAAVRPLNSRACVVFASAGLPFNQSTEEIVIRQQVAPSLPKTKARTNKLRKKRQVLKPHTTSPKRKHLVMPAFPIPTTRTPSSPPPSHINAASTTHPPLPPPRRRQLPLPNKIGSDGAIAIFRALRVNTSLRSLVLENAGITDTATGALAAMIRANCTLTQLSLSQNSITHLGIQVLCEALFDSPDSMLLRLDLSQNCITDAGIPFLSHALKENETLIWLDLSWNRISAKALLLLLRSLRNNFVLRQLAIFGKDIDEDQYCHNLQSKYAKDIAPAIRQLNASFAGIQLSSSKARLPVDKIKSSRWLTLPSHDLVELDALVISGLLPLNTHLLTLDLSNNRSIERWAVLEVLKSIKFCTSLKHVNLVNTGLYEEVGEQIGDLIATNTTLETIIMHEVTLHVQQLRGKEPVEIMEHNVKPKHHFDRWILTKCLALNRPTQELNKLRLPEPPPVSIGAIPTKVGVNYSLRQFEVYEVVFLARKMFYHLHMGRVALNGCGIDSYGGVAIADGVRNHASLEVLELENNTIGVAGGRAMAECVAFNASLTYVNLSWNNIGNDGILGFENALKANKSITRLDLRGNKLTTVGIQAIAGGLKGNACLKELYLRWNVICPTGAEALAQALSVNKTLRLLDIEHHTMGVRGAMAFAEMLSKNKQLVELNMKGDDAVSDGDARGIGSDAAAKLAVVLKEKNRTLATFSIAQNLIGRDGIAAFSDVVKFNSVIKVLDLSISEMDGKTADRFFECLSMNKTITKLNLAHNRICNEGMMACIRMLDVNCVLRELNMAHNAITEEPLALLAAKWQRRKQQQTELKRRQSHAIRSDRVPQQLTLQWLCLVGNTMTEMTRRALTGLAPMVTIELDEELHHQPDPKR